MQTVNTKEKSTDLQPVFQILKESSFQYIVKKAQTLITIEQALHAILPEELAPHCKVMNIQTDTLILGVDDAAWGTRIQFMEHVIITHLHQQAPLKFITIKRVKCRVRC